MFSPIPSTHPQAAPGNTLPSSSTATALAPSLALHFGSWKEAAETTTFPYLHGLFQQIEAHREHYEVNLQLRPERREVRFNLSPKENRTLPYMEIIGKTEGRTGLLGRGKPILVFFVFFPQQNDWGVEGLHNTAMYTYQPRKNPAGPLIGKTLRPYRLSLIGKLKDWWHSEFGSQGHTPLSQFRSPTQNSPMMKALDEKIIQHFFHLAQASPQEEDVCQALGLPTSKQK